jgi:hypothetical protein
MGTSVDVPQKSGGEKIEKAADSNALRHNLRIARHNGKRETR